MVLIRLEKACTVHHLTMSMLLIESGAASTESLENSFAKLSPASWEIFSLEPENHGGLVLPYPRGKCHRQRSCQAGSHCLVLFSEGPGYSTGQGMLEREGEATLAAEENSDYLVALCKTSRLVILQTIIPMPFLPTCAAVPTDGNSDRDFLCKPPKSTCYRRNTARVHHT